MTACDRGRIIASTTEDEARVLWDFHASGRPVFLGMDDLDDNWTGHVPALLGTLFGISGVPDGDMRYHRS